VNGDAFFARQCQRQALDLRASVLKDKEAIHVVDIPRWAGMHVWDLCARLVYDGTIGLHDDHLETSIALAMHHVSGKEMPCRCCRQSNTPCEHMSGPMRVSRCRRLNRCEEIFVCLCCAHTCAMTSS
jgi:hypothetical protein